MSYDIIKGDFWYDTLETVFRECCDKFPKDLASFKQDITIYGIHRYYHEENTTVYSYHICYNKKHKGKYATIVYIQIDDDLLKDYNKKEKTFVKDGQLSFTCKETTVGEKTLKEI